MITRTFAGLVVVLGIASCEKSAPEPAPPVRAVPSVALDRTQSAQPELGRAGELEYLEMVTGGATAGERLPLIVAVHGLGDTPRGFSGLFAGFDVRARLVLPRAPSAHGPGYSWFGYRAEIGEQELARGIDRAAERLADAIDAIARARPTVGRAIVTGFSQGGMLSFAVAAKRPSLVRAAFPVGGALPEPLWPKAAPDGSALHGEDDALVPLAPTKRAVTALDQAGFDVKLETYAGVGHSVPPAMRERLLSLLKEELAR